MWSCSSPRKKTPRKNCRLVKQKTPRILSIWGRVLGVLFRYRSIWHKCAACIRRMQYTKGLGLSQQAFCNAKMAFVYTNALLAGTLLDFNTIGCYPILIEISEGQVFSCTIISWKPSSVWRMQAASTRRQRKATSRQRPSSSRSTYWKIPLVSSCSSVLAGD